MAVPEQVLQDPHADDEETRRAALTVLAQAVDVRALPTLRDIAQNDESMELRFLGKRAILMLAGVPPVPPGQTMSGQFFPLLTPTFNA